MLDEEVEVEVGDAEEEEEVTKGPDVDVTQAVAEEDSLGGAEPTESEVPAVVEDQKTDVLEVSLGNYIVAIAIAQPVFLG